MRSQTLFISAARRPLHLRRTDARFWGLKRKIEMKKADYIKCKNLAILRLAHQVLEEAIPSGEHCNEVSEILQKIWSLYISLSLEITEGLERE